MKRPLTCFLLAVMLPLTIFAQNSKKKKGISILASTSFNFYTPLKPYRFSKEYFIQHDDILLKFKTSNSGTFVIKDGDSILVNSKFDSKMPGQMLGIGCSVQFRDLSNIFHEISLTRLSFSRSDQLTEYTGSHLDTIRFRFNTGHEERMFTIGLRYEMGKYFGQDKDAVVRFGLSGSIEPSFFQYKYRPYSTFDYPLDTRLFTIDLSLIPVLSVKASKLLSIDFKFIPNFLVADFGNMRQNDPTVPITKQGGTRIYKSPDITWAFSAQLRYMLKEGKKKRAKD